MIRLSQIDDKFSIYKENTVVLLGIGAGTKQMLDLLKHHGIDIAYICDSNKDNFGKVLDGVPVISPAHLQELVSKSSNGVMVQISVNNIGKDTESQLFAIGVKAVVSFNEAWQIFNFMNKLITVNKNPHMISAYEKMYIEGRAFNYKTQAFDYICGNCHAKEYIFICSIPKTGDMTIVSTLNTNNISNFMAHHTPEILDKNLILNAPKKIKIFLGVRDPISQNLSFLYEHISGIYQTPFGYHLNLNNNEFFDKGGDVQQLFNLGFDSDNATDYNKSFFERFTSNIYDIFDCAFDKEKGFTIIKSENLEIFAYQLERINDIVTEMSDWIGRKTFNSLAKANEASGKWIASSYKQAQKEITFSREYFDKCYNDPWVKHFYSEEDIAKFKAKWESHVKD